MLEILQEQGTGVVGSKSWGRQLGDGVIEFRLDRTVKSMVGKAKDGKPRTVTEKLVLRVFFHGFGEKKLLLLNGYDKGADPKPSRQQREIALAKQRLRHWRVKRRREALRVRRAVPGASAEGARRGWPGGRTLWAIVHIEMSDDFRQLIDEIEEEARADGPAAVEQFKELRAEFRIANQVLELRRRLGLSQKELARLSGIDQSEISRIENGASNPTYATLERLAEPLGAHVALVRAH